MRVADTHRQRLSQGSGPRFLSLVFVLSGLLPGTACKSVKIVHIHGSVTVTSPDEPPVPATEGMKLDESARVETGANSEAAIQKKSADVLLLPESDATVTEPGIELHAGEAFVHTRGAFAVDTPSATAGVEGTTFHVSVRDRDGYVATTTTVLNGRVRVTSKVDSAAFTLGPNEQVQVMPGQAAQVRPVPSEEANSLIDRYNRAGGWGASALRLVPNVVGSSRQAAAAALTKAGLRSEIQLVIQGEGSVETIVSQEPAAGSGLEPNGAVVLFEKVQPATVPALVGQPLVEAEAMARSAGLSLRISSKIPAVGVSTDTVKSQTPAAGTEVLPGSQVTIEVQSPGVQVPKLNLQTLENAKALLTENGLALNVVSYSPSPNVAPGLVILQNPVEGTVVERGSQVTLTLSSGPELVSVPDVNGMEVSVAEATLRGARLQPFVRTIGGDAGPYTVTQQTPPAGASVAVGTTVTISVMGTIR